MVRRSFVRHRRGNGSRRARRDVPPVHVRGELHREKSQVRVQRVDRLLSSWVLYMYTNFYLPAREPVHFQIAASFIYKTQRREDGRKNARPLTFTITSWKMR